MAKKAKIDKASASYCFYNSEFPEGKIFSADEAAKLDQDEWFDTPNLGDAAALLTEVELKALPNKAAIVAEGLKENVMLDSDMKRDEMIAEILSSRAG